MIWNTNLRWRLPVVCLFLEVALIALFGVFVRYDMDADPHSVWRLSLGNGQTCPNSFQLVKTCDESSLQVSSETSNLSSESPS